MTGREVEAIVRGVIVERAFPFDVLAVAPLPSAWQIRLRHQAAGIMSVTVHDGRPVDIRRAIQEQLEAQS
jgi:hypothetical protein